MKVWMTIGYSDYEGNDEIDKVFTDKEKALDHIIKFVFDSWKIGIDALFVKDETKNKVMGRYDWETFHSKIKKYIMDRPETKYWYFWSGSSWLNEVFDDWTDDCDSWVGFREVEVE